MNENIRYYFRNNLKEYIIIGIIFVIGVITGVMTINNSNANEKNRIIDYINSIIENVKQEEDLDNNKIFIKKIKSNSLFILLCGVIGSTIIGLPILVFLVGYKGFSLGYTISAIMATTETKNGILFSLCSLLLHNITFIFAIFIISVTGLNFCKCIVNNRDREQIKFEISKYLFFMIVSIMIAILSSFIESYISLSLLKFFKKNY